MSTTNTRIEILCSHKQTNTEIPIPRYFHSAWSILQGLTSVYVHRTANIMDDNGAILVKNGEANERQSETRGPPKVACSPKLKMIWDLRPIPSYPGP